VVMAIDREEKLRAALPSLRPMIRQGLVFLVEGEVLDLSGGKAQR